MKSSVAAVAVLFFGFVLFSNAAHTPAAPAPVPDCSNATVKMVDCIDFVTSNGTVKKPKGRCCEGLKTVLKTDPYCICDSFKESIQLGIKINMTQALTLPAVCHLSAPSITKCGLIPGLAPAPAVSPVAPSPSTTTGAPTSIVPAPGASNATTPAPAPAPAAAPGTSSSSTLSFSAGLLLVAMVVSYF